MATTGVITRAVLGLSDLSLSTAPYDIRSFDPGEVVPDEELAGSPYISGQVDVGNTWSDGHGLIVIRITDASTMQASVNTLQAAFGQSSYTLSVTHQGTPWSLTAFRCRGHVLFDVLMRHSNVQMLGFAFRRAAISAAGTF